MPVLCPNNVYLGVRRNEVADPITQFGDQPMNVRLIGVLVELADCDG